jgi:hypothetical protein
LVLKRKIKKNEKKTKRFIKINKTVLEIRMNKIYDITKNEFKLELEELQAKNPFDERVANAMANGNVEMTIKKNKS